MGSEGPGEVCAVYEEGSAELHWVREGGCIGVTNRGQLGPKMSVDLPAGSLSSALELRHSGRSSIGGLPDLRAVDLLAGFTSGCAIVIVGHPFETVRTRMQTTGGNSPGAMLRSSAPNTRSVLTRTIVDLGFIKGLYRGAVPPLATSGCISMCIWTGFESIKRHIHGEGEGLAPLRTVWAAAALAPMAMLPVLVPQQRISKLLQVNARRNEFRSARSVVRAILQREGARGLYRGGSALALQDFFGRANYVTGYEASKRGFKQLNEGRELSMAQRLIAGAISGTLGWYLPC